MNPDNRVMIFGGRSLENWPVLALLLSGERSLAIQLCAPACPGRWIWPKRSEAAKRSGGRL